ncbi:DUF6885 family protein [Amycolatopsis sp.]|uniref:DUF6885 family protein n=1 Tax=Amycolatopsis sp. TaxID=37632 RepID=UPI002DFBDF2E|nr:hypothetical protein [Amycolatopsis sp.]
MSLLAEVRPFSRAFPEGTRRVTATGEWDTDVLARLLLGVHGLRTAAVTAEVDAGELGSPDTPERALRDYLDTGIPPLWTSPWSGHRAVVLGGTLSGPEGTIASIVDGSMSLPVHLQPLDWLAAGLREAHGGVHLDVAPGDVEVAAQVVLSASLECLRPYKK